MWNGHRSSLESGPYGSGKGCAFERKESGHGEKVVEVLHAAVREVERHDGFELLGDHGVAWIRIESRCRTVEKDGIFKLQRTGRHRVSKADVDLYRGGGELGRGANPKSFLGSAARFDKDVFGIETQSVARDRLGADVAKDFKKRDGLAVGEGKEIEVARGSERICEPRDIEHGTLENEEVLAGRDAQSEEKPLKGVASKHALEIVAPWRDPAAVYVPKRRYSTVYAPSATTVSR